MLRITQFILTTAVLSVFTSCGGGEEKEIKVSEEKTEIKAGKEIEKIADATVWDPSWKTTNTVVYHVLGDADDMHPTNSLSAIRQEIALYTQVFLVAMDLPTSGILPQLAAAMPEVSADGLEYIYTLNDYMKWDDGSPITAEDVVFTFKANTCPLVNNPAAKPYFELMKDMIALAPNKVKVIMKEKYIQNIANFTDFCIIQRKFFDPSDVLAKYSFQQFYDPSFNAEKQSDLKTWAKDFNDTKNGHELNRLVGAGPYYVEAWDHGQSLTIAKKKNHWSEGRTELYSQAYPDKIIFKINRDNNSIKSDFLNQVFDVTVSVDIDVMLELQKDSIFTKNYNSRFMNTYNYTYAGMNMKPDGITHKKIFDDVNVRKAMAYLIPYDVINKVANKGVYDRIAGPVSPMKAEYNSDLELINTDNEKGSKMLADAGWKDTDGDGILDKIIDGVKTPMKFQLSYMATSPAWEASARLIAENLKKTGIIAELEAQQLGVFIGNVQSHNFDMMLLSMTGTSLTEDYKQLWHTSAWANNGSNFFGFGNATTDSLIEKIRVTLDDNERIKMSKEMQRLIIEQQPCVFMFAQKRRVAVHKRFGNQEYYFEKPGVLVNRLKLIDAKP